MGRTGESGDKKDVPMCTECGQRPANINQKTGKIVNGKCGHCMSRIMSGAAAKNRGEGEPEDKEMVKTCKVEGCEKKPVAQGFCSGHYSGWRTGNKKLVAQFGEYKIIRPSLSEKMKTVRAEKRRKAKAPSTDPSTKQSKKSAAAEGVFISGVIISRRWGDGSESTIALTAGAFDDSGPYVSIRDDNQSVYIRPDAWPLIREQVDSFFDEIEASNGSDDRRSD